MRSSSIAALTSTGAVILGFAGPVPAVAAKHKQKPWTAAQCEAAVRKWSKHHPHASLAQLGKYDESLVKQHDCGFGRT